MGEKIKWVDCAKCLAILAVMIDHTNGILYTNSNIAIASYFSVSLFIIISGMMSFISNSKHELNWVQTFVRSSKKIVISYLIANIIYLVYMSGFFDVRTYIQYVIGFNLSGPFYYVLLYLQLMMVSRILYSIINRIPTKLSWLYEMGIGAILLMICSWTTNYTNVFDVYGGGGRVLGGTYLFLFYLGMLISKHHIFGDMNLKKSAILSIMGIVLWYGWWKFECVDRFALDAKLPFGAGFNPPSISSGLMAVIILAMSCGVFTLLDHSKYTRWITDMTSWIGKHTLYIFLYHRFFLDYVVWKYVVTDNVWIKRISYFAIMILGSIILEYGFCLLKKILLGQISLDRLVSFRKKG